MSVDVLQKLINESRSIVFFGGAGVSTESGIPDFRSVDGLYNQKYKYPPERILSGSFFYSHTDEFFKFYKERVMMLSAKPNPAHIKLAQLEEAGKLSAVVTQNIDGLHQMAGSKNVLELHGSIHRNYCTHCGKFFDANYIFASEDLPKCDQCHSLIKPDVVLYEEGLDMDVVNQAIYSIASADMLIIGGTSLVVYPAAGLINYYRGNKLVLINRGDTSVDGNANYVFRDSIGELFSKIVV